MVDGESQHVESGSADAVLEVLHTALREIMIETGHKSSGLARPSRTGAAAASQPVTVPIAAAHSASTGGKTGHVVSPSVPTSTGQMQCKPLEAAGEADESTQPDDMLLSRTKANFIEFVLERMLFGVMQEVLAGDTEL